MNNIDRLTDREVREAIYQSDLCELVEREIYQKSKSKRMKGWKLGKLHNEWNEFLLNYDGINVLAPRSHLKTFFFFEARALQLCKFNKDIEIKYFTGSDSLAIERLNNIKEYTKLPYFRSLLNGADINNKTELRFGQNQRISVQGYGSKVRGGHPNYLVLDDVIDSQVIYSDELNKKTKERLATEILPMAEPETQITIVGTVQRKDDIYSVDWSSLLEDEVRKWISKTYDAIVDEEKHITIFPEKWDWNNLMAKKKEITLLSGEKWFLKEYRNMKIDLLGEIIRPEWHRSYKLDVDGNIIIK